MLEVRPAAKSERGCQEVDVGGFPGKNDRSFEQLDCPAHLAVKVRELPGDVRCRGPLTGCPGARREYAIEPHPTFGAARLAPEPVERGRRLECPSLCAVVERPLNRSADIRLLHTEGLVPVQLVGRPQRHLSLVGEALEEDGMTVVDLVLAPRFSEPLRREFPDCL